MEGQPPHTLPLWDWGLGTGDWGHIGIPVSMALVCMYVYSLYQTRRVSRARNLIDPGLNTVVLYNLKSAIGSWRCYLGVFNTSHCCQPPTIRCSLVASPVKSGGWEDAARCSFGGLRSSATPGGCREALRTGKCWAFLYPGRWPGWCGLGDGQWREK